MNDHDIERRLGGLPGLGRQHAVEQSTPCKLCGHLAPPFDVVDFFKYCSPQDCYAFGLSGIPVTYHRCTRCRFIFTRFFDNWSHADFERFIYNEDYIKVDGAYAGVRPKRMADIVAGLVEGIPHETRILDYGSGSGLFAAELRARGYGDVSSYDPFSQSVAPDGTFDLVTLFEVIEHVPDPAALLRDVVKLMRPGGTILFSSGFQPPDIGRLRGTWWYIAPRNGHCSIFAADTMALLAESLGLALRGDAGLSALQAWPSSRITAQLTRRLKIPLFVRHLKAPSASTDKSGLSAGAWHRAEKRQFGHIRWTAAVEVGWRPEPPPLLPCRLRLVVPFVAESTNGYAAGCTLKCNGEDLQTAVSENAIWADVILARPAELDVVLTGPDLHEAVARKQKRLVGLAVHAS